MMTRVSQLVIKSHDRTFTYSRASSAIPTLPAPSPDTPPPDPKIRNCLLQLQSQTTMTSTGTPSLPSTTNIIYSRETHAMAQQARNQSQDLIAGVEAEVKKGSFSLEQKTTKSLCANGGRRRGYTRKTTIINLFSPPL